MTYRIYLPAISLMALLAASPALATTTGADTTATVGVNNSVANMDNTTDRRLGNTTRSNSSIRAAGAQAATPSTTTDTVNGTANDTTGTATTAGIVDSGVIGAAPAGDAVNSAAEADAVNNMAQQANPTSATVATTSPTIPTGNIDATTGARLNGISTGSGPTTTSGTVNIGTGAKVGGMTGSGVGAASPTGAGVAASGHR